MVTETTSAGRLDRISGALYRRPRLRLALLLGLPLLWLVGVYGGSLIAMLSALSTTVSSCWPLRSS